MLTEAELSHLAVVLVRARDPNNIGAVARTMYDFGFRDLRLVNEYRVPFARAKSAVDASAVLEAAREYASVAEAVADCTLVVGTTAVGPRRQEQPLYTLADAGDRLRSEVASGQQPSENQLALLFGSEKTGLSNEELSHCHWLVTIPMASTPGMRHASMNLGPAGAGCLYELVRDAETPPLQELSEAASAADLERLTALLIEVMEKSGYSHRHPANFDEIQVRRLVRQMNLDRSRALAWTGIFRQVLWKLRSKTSDAEAP